MATSSPGLSPSLSPSFFHVHKFSRGRDSSFSPSGGSVSSSHRMKLKKLQSAQANEENGGAWLCKNCNYSYPEPHPSSRVRRNHKKVCPGRAQAAGEGSSASVVGQIVAEVSAKEERGHQGVRETFLVGESHNLVSAKDEGSGVVHVFGKTEGLVPGQDLRRSEGVLATGANRTEESRLQAFPSGGTGGESSHLRGEAETIKEEVSSKDALKLSESFAGSHPDKVTILKVKEEKEKDKEKEKGETSLALGIKQAEILEDRELKEGEKKEETFARSGIQQTEILEEKEEETSPESGIQETEVLEEDEEDKGKEEERTFSRWDAQGAEISEEKKEDKEEETSPESGIQEAEVLEDEEDKGKEERTFSRWDAQGAEISEEEKEDKEETSPESSIQEAEVLEEDEEDKGKEEERTFASWDAQEAEILEEEKEDKEETSPESGIQEVEVLEDREDKGKKEEERTFARWDGQEAEFSEEEKKDHKEEEKEEPFAGPGIEEAEALKEDKEEDKEHRVDKEVNLKEEENEVHALQRPEEEGEEVTDMASPKTESCDDSGPLSGSRGTSAGGDQQDIYYFHSSDDDTRYRTPGSDDNSMPPSEQEGEDDDDDDSVKVMESLRSEDDDDDNVSMEEQFPARRGTETDTETIVAEPEDVGSRAKSGMGATARQREYGGKGNERRVSLGLAEITPTGDASAATSEAAETSHRTVGIGVVGVSSNRDDEDEHGLPERLQEYDVPRMLQEQRKHDFFCPKCGSDITMRIIVRKRKRTSVKRNGTKPKSTAEEGRRKQHVGMSDFCGAENGHPDGDAATGGGGFDESEGSLLERCLSFFFSTFLRGGERV